MNAHLQAAIDFSQNAALDFDRGRKVQGNENIQLSLAAAAIAQAEAAERSAVAMEKIAALLDSVIEKVGGSPAIGTYDAYQAWKENL